MGHPEALIVSTGNDSPRQAKSSHNDDTFSKNNDSKNGTGLLDAKIRALTAFPPSSLVSNAVCLSHVNIDNSKITQLPVKISEQLPMLRVFTANGNELTTLPNDFGELSYLQELCLCDNKLLSLPEQLSNLTQLRVLKLNTNCLTRLHSEIGQNQCLQVLSVNENQLKRFPATLGLLTNLCVLEAKSNVLQVLPSTMNYLQSLKVVNLSSNRLTCIPESVGELKGLTHMDLSANRIDRLCDSFQSSRTLQHLCLDHNALSLCPSWFKDLENIVELKMKCNQLSGLALQEGFGLRTVQLKILDLSGNYIQKLPLSFGHQRSLESLFLGAPVDCLERETHLRSGNWLSSLPSNFAELIFIRQLHLQDCQLRSLPEDFGKLRHLEDLFLGSNIVFELPSSFSQLVALRRCQLSNNRLTYLPEDFGALEMLTELYLDYNKLKTLPDSMKSLTNLELLDLSGNKLKQRPSEIISALAGLKSVILRDGLERAHPSEAGSNSGSDEDTDDVEDVWNEQTEEHTPSSSASYEELPKTCPADQAESWDVEPEFEINKSDLGSGQFDLDDDVPCQPDPSRCGSFATRCLAFHLDIYRHMSTPHVHQTPTMKFLYEADCEVPGQFDDVR